jgi:multidrug efflux pump subunit AcrB
MVTPDLTVGWHLNGRPGVGLDVFKSTGANIVDVADRVMAVVEEQRKLRSCRASRSSSCRTSPRTSGPR